jgi:hypothetical protein
MTAAASVSGLHGEHGAPTTASGRASAAIPHEAPARPIKPRLPQLTIDGGLPRNWAFDNVIVTALMNSVCMLFPAGERFFVRSVHHYLQRADLPAELRTQIQGFFAQEGRHAQQHERVNRLLGSQGYDVDGFLRIYERLCYHYIEKLTPPALHLSATAAAEHFTAILADNFLRMEELTVNLDPTMRRLLLWHAAEEIEHKAVAFDVLKHVAPGYGMRMAGLALASAILGVFWFTGTCVLLWQERRLVGWGRIRADLAKLRRFRKERGRRGIVREVFAAGIQSYLRRDFHPNDLDNYDLAMQYLASDGLN